MEDCSEGEETVFLESHVDDRHKLVYDKFIPYISNFFIFNHESVQTLPYNYFGSNLPKVSVKSSILERLKFELDRTMNTVL